MAVEFVNAIDAAAAAESECARLRRLLEEERKVVQRLQRENVDEAQMAKRKIEKMSYLLAEAHKDAKHATIRADFAENEWVKVKRELQETRELVQLLKPEGEETRQGVSTRVDDKELELNNALGAASTAERECAQLKRMLEEEQKIVHRLRLEKDDEVQLAKTQIGEIDQELACAQSGTKLARKHTDVAEVKSDLKRMEELVKLLELEHQEMRSECTKLRRMLVEEGNTVQTLMLEKNDEAELAKRQVEKIIQELANARKDAQFARKDADIVKNEWIKLRKELEEKEQFIIHLKQQILEMRIITMRQVEDISQELDHVQKEAEYARYDANIAKNEWFKTKKELQEKLELVQLLKLECQDTRENAMRQVEEKELELADALDAATVASSGSAAAKDCAVCLVNEKDTVFGCGHMTCEKCGMKLIMCPICRIQITHRIKLFPG
ncbi:E3 ubiquitin-protein ligase LRSAM1 isoform X5 [Neltuma alba]|uniref:E3 ubiquitin-protein ligase LRSAM1 isoform X5 n=1 Tax=Neltuma alba TaxID=207710 RepID=UPI0010A45153|nr:E3 ubiquitin-protein ligase LRSAM1-like isoform X5 [Prosopis alba]